jgi:hypothetical protein
MSESVFSAIADSGFLRLRVLGRRGGHGEDEDEDEGGDLDDSAEDGGAEAFDGLDERTRGEAFLLTGLGFFIGVTRSVGIACSVGAACSIGVTCSVRVTDSSDTCDAPVFLALVAFLLVVAVTTGAGGSSLKTHSPSSRTPRVYQPGVSSTSSSLAIVRNLL